MVSGVASIFESMFLKKFQIEYEYSFIDAGYEDPAIIKYFVTEEANRIKQALYCIVSIYIGTLTYTV